MRLQHLAILLSLGLFGTGISQAEDPFLGEIKEIKCVNCKPGWVTLVIHDPIDMRDFELYLKDADYNKIITPLPGKRVHDRNGECFYWMEKSKAAKPASAAAPKAPSAAAPADSTLAPAGTGRDTSIPPPSEETDGNPSTCIRFFRQMK